MGVTSSQTRKELVEAAQRVLLARGYEGTRVSEIASEAGLTTGAIYNHFSSKADLLSAAIAERAPDVISELLQSGDGASVLEAIRRIGTLLPESTAILGPLVLEFVVTSTRDDDVARVVRPGFAAREAKMARAIRLAQASGDIDSELDAGALARLTTLLALGSLAAGALELAPVERSAWADVIGRMLDASRPKVGVT